MQASMNWIAESQLILNKAPKSQTLLCLFYLVDTQRCRVHALKYLYHDVDKSSMIEINYETFSNICSLHTLYMYMYW